MDSKVILKRTFSVFLALLMMTSMITGLDFSAYASQTSEATSAEFTPVKTYEVIQNTNGYFDEYENQWYYYAPNFVEGDKITIQYADNSADEYIYESVYLEDEGYYSYEFANSENEILDVDQFSIGCFEGLGNTSFEVIIGDYEITIEVPVTIVENPVESAEFTPVEPFEIVQNSNGYFDEDSQQWYYYSPELREGDKITVHYKDGTSDEYIFSYDSYDFENADNELLDTDKYNIGCFDGIGKTSFEIVLIDYETRIDAPVTIIENPVKSAKFTPVEPFEIVQNSNGYFDDYENKWYYYSPEFRDGDKITVNYTDGKSEEYTFSYDLYGFADSDGESLNYYCSDIGNFEGTGETSFVIELGDYGTKIDVPVTIVENPVKSAEFTPVEPFEIIQNTNGYFDDYESQWYYYAPELREGDKITVNYTDGKSEEYVFSYYSYEFVNSEDESLSYGRSSIGTFEGTGETSFKIELNDYGTKIDVPVTIIENPVKSAEFTPVEPLEITKNTNGYFDEDNQQWYYNAPEFRKGDKITVNYTDGKSEEYVFNNNYYDFVNTKGKTLQVSCEDLGYFEGTGEATFEATLIEYGLNFDIPVSIVESPFKSVVVEYKGQLIENIDGYAAYDDYDNEFFKYTWDSSDIYMTVTYNDGKVVEGISYDVEEKTGATLDCYADQSYTNQWTIGKNLVNFNFAGISGTFYIEVVENPIESVEFSYNYKPIENVDGYTDLDEYNNSKVFSYNFDLKYLYLTVTYKDGTVYKGSYNKVSDEIGIHADFDDLLYSTNSWKLGKNYIEYNYAGFEGEFVVEVVSSNVKSIEIVEPVIIADDNFDHKLKFRINYKDGTSEFRVYDDQDDRTRVYKSENDAENNYNVTLYYGAYFDTASVQKEEQNDFKYIVQDNAAIITEARVDSKEIVIPSEIDGLPVIGINSLSFSWNSTIKTVTVPDSVKFLSDGWIKKLTGVEVINIGKNVSYIDCDMFTNNASYFISDNLKEINISSENEYYCDIDGVVYSKDGKTLVVYPIAKSDEYNVPDGVTNIGVIYNNCYSSVNVNFNNNDYVTVDDVIYTKDMKNVVHCNAEKSGSYVMPNTVETITEGAFKNCDNLESVDISDNVTDIVYASFADCKGLKTVSLPENLKSIGDYAFGGCTSIDGVTLGDNVTSVGEKSFVSCDSLNSLDLGSSLVSIGDGAFSECTELTELSLPSTVKTIGSNAFAYCSSVQNLNINEGLETISYKAFNNCSSLKSLVIPDSVKQLGDSCFAYCSSLESAVIGSGVTTIPYDLFANCSKLSDITLTDNITYIKDYAFHDTKYYNDKSNWKDGVLYIGNHLIMASDDLSGQYDIKTGTKTIAEYAFSGCSELSGVTIPDSVVTIADNAFSLCKQLKDVSIGKGVKSIGKMAFSQCYNMTDIDIPEGVETIGLYAFEDADLKEITIPDTVTEIVYGAFYNNESLSKINMPDKLVSIGGNTFYNTDWYDNQPNGKVYISNMLYSYKGYAEGKVVVDEDTLGISDYAFQNQAGISDILLPEGLQEIGRAAFLNCNDLKVYIPESVTSIRTCALGYENLSYTDVENDDLVSYINKNEFKVDGYCIYGYAGTEAERYAKDNGFKFVALKNLTDGGSNISLVLCDLGDGVTLNVDKLDTVSYKVSLIKSGKEIQPNGSVIVKIPVPSTMDGSKLNVYKAESNGKYTNMNAAYQDGCMIFISDSLGTFTLSDGTPVEKQHKMTKVAAKKATCTSDGNYQYYKCSTCGKVFKDAAGKTATTVAAQTIKKTGHKMVKVAYKKATCTANGNYQYYKCSTCGKLFKDAAGKTATTVAAQTIKKTGHKMVKVAYKKATCKATGNYQYYKCSTCGKVFKDAAGKTATTVAAQTIKKTAHTYKTYKSVTKATQKKDGKIVTTVKCSVCGAVKSRSTKKIPRVSKVTLQKTTFGYNWYYTGKEITPRITVKDSTGKTLKRGTDYSLTYDQNRRKIGRYAIKVTFKGNYSGTKTFTFDIVPRKTTITSVIGKKRGFTVWWKKNTVQTKGYQIQYSTAKNMKNAVTVAVTKNNNYGRSITGRMSKRTYYVRMRVYSKVKYNGKWIYVYSPWTTCKSVRTK